MKAFYSAKSSFDRHSQNIQQQWEIPLGQIDDDLQKGIEDNALFLKA